MAPVSKAVTPEGQRARLLIVEDEMSTVFALRAFFAHAGYDVDCAGSLRDGYLLLDRNGYDAIITDLQLTPSRASEGMSIAALARQRNPHACVVLLTAYGSEATEQAATRHGVDLYHTKPVELPRLAACIEAVLNGQSCKET